MARTSRSSASKLTLVAFVESFRGGRAHWRCPGTWRLGPFPSVDDVVTSDEEDRAIANVQHMER